MIKFFGNIYFGLMEALMWIILIGSPITFAIVGAQGEIGGSAGAGGFLGLIMGALIGFVINLCMVPFLQLMEIRNDVKILVGAKGVAVNNAVGANVGRVNNAVGANVGGVNNVVGANGGVDKREPWQKYQDEHQL